MELEQAKRIHSIVMAVLMHTQGIGEVTGDDVIAISDISLLEMLQANSVMEKHKELTEISEISFITTTTKSLAELYLRVHNKEFMVANDFQEICSAMDDAFEGAVNGHGVLIDGAGYYSLIELSNSGDCADKTLVTLGTPREMYDYAKRRISETELADELT
jgi:hypothetical protein